MRTTLKLVFICITVFIVSNALDVRVDTDNSLVASTSKSDKESGKETSNESTPQTIYAYQMKVTSQVSNRFAHTTILSKYMNYGNTSNEAIFAVVLPETAFISGFIMEIDGKNYTAYVKEKEEAKKTYAQAVASGQSAAHVAVSARDSNRFTVSVNVEPEMKACFYLTYEELLKRHDDRYEMVINLHPGQTVTDLSVTVTINESRKIQDLKVPPLRSGNEIGNQIAELDPRANINVIDDKSVVVTFSPNLETQKQLGNLLGNKEDGLAGQFVVQYDVERDPQGGEIVVFDSYFAHFFAPSDLEPIPKHVVFVLDTSGSMGGQKIQQLRESMVEILGQLNKYDKFDIIEFNTIVRVLNLEDDSKSVQYPLHGGYGYAGEEGYPTLHQLTQLPSPES